MLAVTERYEGNKRGESRAQGTRAQRPAVREQSRESIDVAAFYSGGSFGID
jgi:hypothetical protein